MTVDCTGEDFRDLKNPYTGEPMRVKMLVAKSGAPRFFSPATYSTHMRFGSAQAAYAAWARQDGIVDARKGKEIRCAYTGEILSPKHDGTGYWFDGGFDPRRFWTRQEFLHFARMRDGKSPVSAEPVPRAEPGRREPAPKPRGHAIEPGQEALDIATSVATNAGIPKRTAVAAGGIPGKGKRRRG